MSNGTTDLSHMQPIIVVGMHRSGTSLLTRLLERLGVWMGADCTRVNRESIFWRRINEQILSSANASWHSPHQIEGLLSNPQECEEWRQRITKRLQNHSGYRYLGLANVWKGNRFGTMPQPWGWKDPRTTLTLPIWSSIFPNARYLYIMRNGIDVANSLLVRERKAQYHWKARLLALSRGTLKITTPKSVPDLESGFELWKYYVTVVEKALASIPDHQLLSLRFEHLAEASEETISDVVSFLKLPCSTEQTAEVASQINGTRKYAFIKDPALVTFYESVQDDDVMRKYGYDEILKPQPSASKSS